MLEDTLGGSLCHVHQCNHGYCDSPNLCVSNNIASPLLCFSKS